MSDIGEQLGPYIDGAAPTITLDEIVSAPHAVVAEPGAGRDGARGQRDDRPAGGHWRAALAVAAAAVLLVGIAIALRSPRDAEQVATGPGTTMPAEDVAWLTPFGTEGPAPAVPAGWRVLDYRDVRFAAPAAWTAAWTTGCAPSLNLLVVGSGGAEGAVPCPADGPSEMRAEMGQIKPQVDALLIALASTPAGQGAPTMVGALPGEQAGAPSCSSCNPTFRLDNGLQVEARGEALGTFATFSDAGHRRVLQSGPVADVAGWETITYDGIAIDVPSAWRTRDLPADFKETRRADGVVTGQSGTFEPGTCDGSLFPPNPQPIVTLGSVPLKTACPAGFGKTLEPGDGVWIRARAADDVGGAPVTHGTLHGLTVDIPDPNLRYDGLSPTLDVDVHVGDGTERLTIGVGLDPSIARAILRSIRPAGATQSGSPAPSSLVPSPTSPVSTPVSKTGSTPGPTTATSPADLEPYCAAVRTYQQKLATEFGGGSQPGMSAEAVRAEDRGRLEAIARLAPPDEADAWSTLAAVGLGPAVPPGVLERLNAALQRTCGIVGATHPPGTEPAGG